MNGKFGQSVPETTEFVPENPNFCPKFTEKARFFSRAFGARKLSIILTLNSCPKLEICAQNCSQRCFIYSKSHFFRAPSARYKNDFWIPSYFSGKIFWMPSNFSGKIFSPPKFYWSPTPMSLGSNLARSWP